MDSGKFPFTNAHVHIFTGDHVPSYIAKKIIPWPLYYLTHIHTWVKIYTWWKTEDRKWKKLIGIRQSTLGFIKAHWLTWILYSSVIGVLLLNAIYFLIDLGNLNSVIAQVIPDLLAPLLLLLKKYTILNSLTTNSQVVLIFGVSFLSANARKLIWFLLKKIFSPLNLLKKEQLAFASRYLDIVEFSKYQSQEGIFNKLKKMYPAQSRLVVLPMDMEYIGAGKTKESYLIQIEKLNTLVSKPKSTYKDKLIPFVFVDPRRIRGENGHQFFNWTYDKGIISLGDCLLKKYLEPVEGKEGNGQFKGVKIYPALGYYPFDRDLLPLWLYCSQNDIPITTHCTYGTIYYRGKVKSEWFRHPIFEGGNFEPLVLATPSNRVLQINFSHPLNYLGLLEPRYLHFYLSKLNDPEIDVLFGKNADGYNTDLSNLKINFAHYGGTDEWHKYLKEDRNEPTLDITEDRGHGLKFFKQPNKDYPNELSKPYALWKGDNIDWFSVITSLMWQYPNVYADVSYVLHNSDLIPLIKDTLEDPTLRERVLFGTDFYVVRNHKSEKEFVGDLAYGLPAEMMHQISRVNPKSFLSSKFSP